MPKKIKVKNYEPENQMQMSKREKIDFVKYPHKNGNHYVIVPSDTNKKMKEGKTTKDVTFYWEQEDIGKIIQQNFHFSDRKLYNIYLLQSEGWRIVSKKIKKGIHLRENEERVLDCIIDSDANNLNSDAKKIYAIEIEEIDTK